MQFTDEGRCLEQKVPVKPNALETYKLTVSRLLKKLDCYGDPGEVSGFVEALIKYESVKEAPE